MSNAARLLARKRRAPRRPGPAGDLLVEERQHLERVLFHLSREQSDPKLDAVRYFLEEKGWLQLGCIVFSQFFDTASWIAEQLDAA